jgi:hypothetical protein
METMIHDLLTLSRVGEQAKGMTSEMTNVAAGAQEDRMSKVEAAGGTLQIDVAPSTVSCNRGLLRQVLWNLGENALKYRRPDVPLRLEIYGHPAANTYELIVSDNGSGRSPWVARQGFEACFRGKDREVDVGDGPRPLGRETRDRCMWRNVIARVRTRPGLDHHDSLAAGGKQGRLSRYSLPAASDSAKRRCVIKVLFRATAFEYQCEARSSKDLLQI